MTKTQLTNVVKRYVDNGDFETAKNYIRSFGPQLKGYDVDKELKKIDELKIKAEKPAKQLKPKGEDEDDRETKD